MLWGQNGGVCPFNEHWMLSKFDHAHHVFDHMAERNKSLNLVKPKIGRYATNI